MCKGQLTPRVQGVQVINFTTIRSDESRPDTILFCRNSFCSKSYRRCIVDVLQQIDYV